MLRGPILRVVVDGGAGQAQIAKLERQREAVRRQLVDVERQIAALHAQLGGLASRGNDELDGGERVGRRPTVVGRIGFVADSGRAVQR